MSLFCAFVGTSLIITTSAIVLNNRLGNSPSQNHSAIVINRYKTKDNKNNTYYHLIVSGWGESPSSVQIGTNEVFYEAHPPNSFVNVKTRRGFLGYEWIYTVN